ncbi:MAG: TonB-dependent receptor, partial [Cellvibrionales bacterium]|nr:TonB-dependent receptor [Cellvibrionales bacterium]
YDTSAQPGQYIDLTNQSNSLGQELRVNFDYDRVTAVVGVYYNQVERELDQLVFSKQPKIAFQSEALPLLNDMVKAATKDGHKQGALALGMSEADAEAYAQNQVENDAATIAGIEANVNAIWGATPDIIDVRQKVDGTYDIKNTALFGEATFEATEGLFFTFGARYDQENQQRNIVTLGTSLTRTQLDEANLLLDELGKRLSNEGKRDIDYKAFLPKAAVQYFFTDNINTAFVVQKGYRAGGFSVNQLDGKVHEFDSEYTWNYELALRTDFDTVSVNANIFYTDWKDMQLDVSPTGHPLDSYVDNVGESHLYGAEVEVSSQITEEIEVFANVGYVQTEFEEFTINSNGQDKDLTGYEFPRSPNLTSAIGFNYAMQNGFHFGLDANYQDKVYLENDNSRETDARTLLNAKIGYQYNHFGAYLWGTNVTNEEYIISSYQNSPGLGLQDKTTPGAPRMFGVTMNVEF